MVRILAVADEVADALDGRRLTTMRPDLVLGAGDLPWDYLEFLSSMLDVPVVFVPGNHDPAVERARQTRSGLYLRHGRLVDAPRPHGVTNLHGAVADVAGLRIAGLGGCVRYRPGPNMYTQKEYDRIGRRLVSAARRLDRREARPVDVLLTHAPPFACGDLEDPAHVGIEALHDVIAALQPRWHLHGHIHPYGRPTPDRWRGGTRIRNVIPYRLFEVPTREEQEQEVDHAR